MNQLNQDLVNQNNKLIADFIKTPIKQVDFHDGKGLIDCYFIQKSKRHGGLSPFQFNELLYHESWDWLIPVVNLVFKSFIGDVRSGSFRLEHKIKEAFIKCDIDEVWHWIVEYIKWFNRTEK